ncbi:MAG: enoyl-CoA hydratase-related protein [Gammaproteobacteria bacterium]|nr:enoyl-CoA hydratase-related protein [Gammaproteobacteria bacterium]
MLKIDKHEDVFVLTMTNGENRWHTTFTRAFNQALNEIEQSSGPAALVTASDDPKFFSNGLDLEWMSSEGEHPGGDRSVFGAEIMTLFGRMITFPMPTICAINGHTFGAGFMIALCHDERIMREDRGYLCANEIELGMQIPEPELALFRHKIPMPAFFQTVQFARRWTGPDALTAGIVQQVTDQSSNLSSAIARAQSLAHLANNRKNFQWMKEHIYGENAAINGVHGPAYMLRNSDQYAD